MKDAAPERLQQVVLRLLLWRLFVPLLAVTLLVIAGIAFQQDQNIKARQIQLVDLLTSQVNDYLEKALGVLSVIGQNVDTMQRPEDIQETMQVALLSTGSFNTLFYLDENGRILVHVPNDPSLLGIDMSSQPFYASARGISSRGFVATPPYISLETHGPTMTVVRPLSGGRMLVGELNLKELQRITTLLATQFNQEDVFITDAHGTLLTYSQTDLVSQRVNVQNLDILHRDLETPQALWYINQEALSQGSTLVLGAAKKTDNTNWIVVAQTPFIVVYGSLLVAIGLVLIIIPVIWLVLFLTLRWNFNQQIVNPLARLSAAVRSLTRGEVLPAETLQPHGVFFAELNELASDFEQMNRAIYERQMALTRERDLVRSILEASPEAIVISTPEGVILDCNQATCQATGYTHKEDIFGQSFDQFMEEEELDRFAEETVLLLEQGHHANREFTITTVNGDQYPGEISGGVVYDTVGDPVSIVRVLRDITERKEFEQALLESREVLYQRLATEELAAEVSTRFVNLSSVEIDTEIEATLAAIGAFVGADRCYLDLLSADETLVIKNYQWCTDGISLPFMTEGVSLVGLEWFFRQLRTVGLVNLRSLDQLPDEAFAERKLWTELGCVSIVALPLTVERVLIGIMGFTTVQKEKVWQPEDIRLIGVIGEVFVNALQRKRFEDELIRTREFTQAVIDAVPNFIHVRSPEGVFQMVNRVVAENARMSKEQIIGRLDSDVFPEVNRTTRDLDQRVLALQQPIQVEESRVNADGTTSWNLITRVPLFHSNGAASILAVVTDITEIKRAGEETRKSEQKFRSVVEQSYDGFLLVDETGTVVEWNGAQEQITGIKREDVIGRLFAEVAMSLALPVDKVVQVQEWLMGARTDSLNMDWPELSGKLYEQELQHPDGVTKAIQILLYPIHLERGVMVSAITRDVTERKRAEEALKASLAEKEVLLREVHHRVKNNLQTMIALIALQSRSITDPVTLQMFKELQDRARTMALIHESLYSSQNLARVDFADYLHKLTTNLLQSFGSDRLIRLNLEIGDVPSLSVDAAIPCGLVINELITNSLKYAFPAGWKQNNDVCEIGICLQKEGGEYVLQVWDNGIGLPSNVDPANTETLGLKLVSILVQHQLRGRLMINTQKGTEFYIRFLETRKSRGV